MFFRTRSRHGRLTLAAAIVLAAAVVCSPALAARPPAARLLPHSTLAMASITDAPTLVEKFMKTSMGRMSQDPQLKPLLDQLFAVVVESTAELEEQAGLSLEDILSIPQGELTIALVGTDEGPPAIVLMIDTGDHLSKAQILLKRGTEALDNSNRERSEETVSDTKIICYDGAGPDGEDLAYFEKDSTIVVCTRVEVLKTMLTLWNRGEADSLADNQEFAAIMQRCGGLDDEPPQIIAFADPIAIFRMIIREDGGSPLVLNMLPILGLDGLTGVGASVFFDAGQYDSIMHLHVGLRSPRAGVLKMIALKPGEVKPEPWVPADVAHYSTLHWDFQKTFDNLAYVYDAINGEGALAGELEREFFGPTGIKLEEDILQSLEGRVTILTRIEHGASFTRAQGFLVGAKLSNVEKAKEVLDKITELADSELEKKEFGSNVYYQPKMPEFFQERPEEERPQMPCFGILDDYVLASNQDAFYKKVIGTASGSGKSLAGELDFKLIASKIRSEAGATKPGMISFDRPEEALRWLYEMASGEAVTTGLSQAAENNPFMKGVDQALKDNPLPPFSVVRQYLAPSGAMVVDDETGIHYMTFSLRRK